MEKTSAIIRLNANLIDKKEVIQAYEDGEALIGGVSYSSEQIETPEYGQSKNVSNSNVQ